MNRLATQSNDSWLKIKSFLGMKKFISYSAYDAYNLMLYTFVLTAFKEYGIKAAKLTMLWFDLDSESNIASYEAIIKADRYLAMGDRMSYINSIKKFKVTSRDIDNYDSYLSASQWFAAMLFLDKKYLNRDLGPVDDSALFPSNITRERTESYLTNPTKLPIFQEAVTFVDGIPFMGNNAMKLHLIALTTSLMWYSDEPIWAKEHNNMWVNGNKANLWLERRARLNTEINTPFNKGGIF